MDNVFLLLAGVVVFLILLIGGTGVYVVILMVSRIRRPQDGLLDAERIARRDTDNWLS